MWRDEDSNNTNTEGGKMKRTPTAAQIEARDARRARFNELVKKIAAMSKEEKARWVETAGVVVTIEGHALSPRNTIFCYFQRQDVTIVGGFRQWIKAGRCVKKGEHGMSILVPSGGGKKGVDAGGDDDADAGEGRVFFIPGTVFDIGQTEEIETDKDDDTNAENVGNRMQLELIEA